MALVWAATQLPMIGSVGLMTVIACRVTLGAAEGPAYPVALHSLYKWFPDRLRTVPSALVAQGAGLALTLPALNWLIVRYSWNWAFGALGIAGLTWPKVGSWHSSDDGDRDREGRIIGIERTHL